MGTSNAIAAAARYNFDFIPFSFYAWHGPVGWLGAQVLGPATLIDKDESSEHPQQKVPRISHKLCRFADNLRMMRTPRDDTSVMHFALCAAALVSAQIAVLWGLGQPWIAASGQILL